MRTSPTRAHLDSVPLAQYLSLEEWKPEIGDFIVWHGWFQHWFGVVSAVSDTEVTVIRKGMPILVLTIVPSEQDKNKLTLDLAEVKSGGSFWIGNYATIKAINNNLVWYI